MTIDLAREAPFKLGELEVRPATREVASSHRRETVEPRVMQVLVALARRRAEVVSRDELIADCWGGMAVGEDAIHRAVAGVRRLAEVFGGFSVETVARVGHRLTVQMAPEPMPSIAVMPFANLSGDPEQDYFADGMVEEIIRALSRFKSIFVIGSGSTLSFKGKPVSPPEVGQQLGVRYLLEGSVRKAGNRVRIAVKLTEAADGAQVWADRFEDTLEDVFALQDNVALAVASVIEPTVRTVEARRAARKPVESLSSYDLHLRAMPLTWPINRERIAEALALLERAVEQDPSYSPALAWLAFCLAATINARWSRGDEAAQRSRVFELARQAVWAAPDDTVVLARSGFAMILLAPGSREGAELIERSVALNAGDAFARYDHGLLELQRGEPERAIADFHAALRLDPLNERIRTGLSQYTGFARFQQRRFEEAAALLGQAAASMNAIMSWAVLAATLGHLGDIENARAALARHRAQVGDVVVLPPMLGGRPEIRKLFEDGIALAEGRTPS
jgi:TolB-like protein